MQSLVEFLIRFRFLLAAACIIVSGVTLWGINYSTIESRVNSILSEDDPYKAQVDEVREDFPPSDGVMFVFQAQPDIFSMQALEAMQEFTDRYTDVKGALAVSSLINRRLNDSDAARLDRDYLIPLLTDLDDTALTEVRRTALADEDLTKSVLSASGDMALANIKYSALPDTQDNRLAIGRSIVALRDDLRSKYPDVEIYAVGNVLFELDGYNAQIDDRTLLLPIVMILGIALLWLCLRSLLYGITLFALAYATVALSVGTFGWLGVPFNQISSLGPLVVLVIAIADGIHIVSVYAQGLYKGMSRLDAMRDSLAINIQPVTLATITTAMGFLSLNYSSSPGIYGFGNIVAIGVVWAFVVTMALLPAIILLLPTNKVPKPLGVQDFIVWVNKLVQTRGAALFYGSLALILITLALLPMNKLDFNRFNFIDEDSDLHHVIESLAQKIGNDKSLVYGISSNEYYGITDVAFLNEVARFSAWLEAQPEASFVRSYSDYLKSRYKAEYEEDNDVILDEDWEELPQDRLQIVDYLVGYQLVQEINPDLEPIFNADYSSIRLIIGTSNLSNVELLEFGERIDAWIDTNLNPDYRVLHGDNSILFARLDQTIAEELLKGFALSFVGITLTLLVGLRSLRYGLLSIAPNLFPATIVFGFWGLFVGELSPYILMLFSISIGLVVDDSVHILSKYITARREGKVAQDAVSYSLDKAGSAITITTISLSVGTFILIFSNTFHFQNVALLLTPIIIVALLLDLLFLPPLLTRLDGWLEARRAKTAQTVT
ncbi:MAG: MMPL family transporter [Pseudomonadota bacterium]